MLARMHELYGELSRRRVIRTTGIYVVGVWLLAQGAADLFPAFGLPDWTVRAFVIGGVLGLPLVIVLAWMFDITPHGVVRDPQDIEQVAGASGNAGTAAVTVSARWQAGDGNERHRRFSTEFVIGRDFSNEIHFADKRVSRHHARVFYRAGDWHVKDLGSSNGTYVNGERVTEMLLPSFAQIRCHANGPQVEVQIDDLDRTEICTSGV